MAANDVKTRAANNAQELLVKWLVEVTLNRESHYATAKQVANKQMWTGYPIAVLNAVIASFVFVHLSKETAIGWKITTAVVSILAGILAAVAAFG